MITKRESTVHIYTFEQKITECDDCLEKFHYPVDGIGIVGRGASGRWCVVMWVCNQHGINDKDIMTDEQMAQYIADNYPGDWADLDM